MVIQPVANARMTSLEGFGCGAAELRFCRSMVFGPAREWPWIAAVYRPFGHAAGTPQVLCRGVGCRMSGMTIRRWPTTGMWAELKVFLG